MRKVVVFPQPDEPSSTVISELGMSIERFPTATVPSGYCLVTSLSVIKDGMLSDRSARRLVFY
jgi:hypothetical protein